MSKHRNKKNKNWDKKAPRKTVQEQLESVNQQKQRILEFAAQGRQHKAEEFLGYLRENYQTKPDLLAKNLCDLAAQLPDRVWQLELYREASELNYIDSVALTSYATALANAGDNDQAFQLFQRSLDINPDDTVTLTSYATALANAGDNDQAFQLFQRSLDINPDDTVTLNSYATALANAGDNDQAFQLFQRSLDISQDNTVTLTSYATALANAGDNDQAFQLFQRSLDISQDNTVTLNSYATALANAGDNDQAFQLFQRSLDISQDNTVTLNSYATALANAGDNDQAFQLFQRSLDISQDNTVTLTSYATALANAGDNDQAFQLFQRSLDIKEDSITLTSYATALANAGDNDQAFQLFQRSLDIKEDSITLTSYATALANAGDNDQAFQLFQRSLDIKEDSITLTSYATALANAGDNDQAFQLFQRSLDINPDDTVTLNSYATALANAGDNDQAFQLFQRSLDINPDDTVTLNSYATALANAGDNDQAFQLFQRSLDISQDNTVTLNSYATALANAGDNDQAFQLFQRSLDISQDNTVTLNSYATALANAGDNDQAFQYFEQSLKVKPDDIITLLQFGLFLETQNQPNEAINLLEQIPATQLDKRSVSFLYLNLGRLYYQVAQKRKANEFFELAAINHPHNEFRSKLEAACQILATDPYSEAAVLLLKEVVNYAPHFRSALKMLNLNLDLKEQYQQFGIDDEKQERLLLNRTIYHKILNEISILKASSQRIAKQADIEKLSNIIEHIEYISDEINKRRHQQDEQLADFDYADYEAVLKTVADTAQNISDFVNNEVAVIKQRLRLLLKKINDESTQHKFQRLLEQIEFTESALNDLKTVNEAVSLHLTDFSIQQLFSNWQQTPYLNHANINVRLDDPDTIFYGDEQKIKSILKELIDNSIRHNPAHTALTINLIAKDIEKLPSHVLYGKMPSKHRYLNILFFDNGIGIPDDKKDWIFQPLKTTSKEGSGLGLFIIRRTVRAMRGYILERGQAEQGVRFEIYLPYGAEQWRT